MTVQTEETREQHISFLKNQTDRLWFAWEIVSNPDSGGAVFHVPKRRRRESRKRHARRCNRPR